MEKGWYLCANLTVIVSIWRLRQGRWSLFFPSWWGALFGAGPRLWGEGGALAVLVPFFFYFINPSTTLYHSLILPSPSTLCFHSLSISFFLSLPLSLPLSLSRSLGLIRTDGGRVFFVCWVNVKLLTCADCTPSPSLIFISILRMKKCGGEESTFFLEFARQCRIDILQTLWFGFVLELWPKVLNFCNSAFDFWRLQTFYLKKYKGLHIEDLPLTDSDSDSV